jgi:hypothetical protein
MTRSKMLVLVGMAAVAVLAISGGVLAGPNDNFNNEQHHDMTLVGTDDLQARSSYQPTLHKYPGNHYFLFVGHHTLGTNPVTGAPLPSFNRLTHQNEENGTSIVDVTDPKKPKYLVHIPVPDGQGGGAQMVRVCDGIGANLGKVFMLRSYASAAHEIWDVTIPKSPVAVRTVAGGNPVLGANTGDPAALAGTHKSWWECDTGIAYIVGRRGNDGTDGWRGGNHIFIFDLSDPANPVFLRDWALEGQEPGGAIPPHFTAVPSIHGPISTGRGAEAALVPAFAASNPVGGTGATLDRVYFAYGTGANGVMQVADRTKLLPPPWGTGIRCGSAASSLIPAPPATVPCNAAMGDFKTAEIGRLIMNPDNGAHTSFPIGRITVPDFVTDTGNDDANTTRDIVVITSEATAHFCSEFRHLTFLTDVSDRPGAPGVAGRPQVISTAQTPASDGNFCDKGGRFGPHATNEEFGPPFYQKIVFVSYFNAGVRAFDVRDPYNPQEVASFIPAVTRNTDFRCGTYKGTPNVCRQVIQTNNVATDDRGCVYIVDRADTGLHVLALEGQAGTILGNGAECRR